MKIGLVIVALVVAPTLASADVENLSDRAGATVDAARAGTHYANVMALYDAGRLPSIDTLRGWRAGRCYMANTPNKPEAGLLAVYNAISQDHGPLAPSFYRFAALVISPSSNPPDSFEFMSEEQVKDVRDSVVSAGSSQVGELGGALASNAPGGVTYHVRKNGDYHILKFTDSFGRSVGACYYFQKVK